MNVSVVVDHELNPECMNFDNADIKKLAEFVMKSLALPDKADVSITFVDEEEIARLNEEYRGKVGPTDVLSFECDNVDDGFPQGQGPYELGDIVIATNVAAKQAEELNHSLKEEIELLCVHGLLHLVGYDHIKDDDAKIMEDKQTALLNEWQEATYDKR